MTLTPTPVVIIATKGRPSDVPIILQCLAQQTLPPKAVIFVGTEPSDLGTIADAPAYAAVNGVSLFASRPGLTIQRNVGLDHVAAEGMMNPYFVAFFDDDFRPAPDWLAAAASVFAEEPSVMGVTGQVLADGIKGAGLTEEAATEILAGQRPGNKCWAQGDTMRDVSSAYGCNMAFRDQVVEKLRFDEDLPLYGWQEDRDFTGQVWKMGRVVYHPAPKGVHLGSKSGRNSGRRMGYSQIANPLYLQRKGTMTPSDCRRFVWRALAANIVKSLRQDRFVDYRGRLQGNFIAVKDLLRRELHPNRVASV